MERDSQRDGGRDLWEMKRDRDAVRDREEEKGEYI